MFGKGGGSRGYVHSGLFFFLFFCEEKKEKKINLRGVRSGGWGGVWGKGNDDKSR